nr:MAG TPA: hypothetical protein [Caudoviricetes sp.]
MISTSINRESLASCTPNSLASDSVRFLIPCN